MVNLSPYIYNGAGYRTKLKRKKKLLLFFRKNNTISTDLIHRLFISDVLINFTFLKYIIY